MSTEEKIKMFNLIDEYIKYYEFVGEDIVGIERLIIDYAEYKQVKLKRVEIYCD